MRRFWKGAHMPTTNAKGEKIGKHLAEPPAPEKGT